MHNVSEGEILQLPKLALVSLAARCARLEARELSEQSIVMMMWGTSVLDDGVMAIARAANGQEINAAAICDKIEKFRLRVSKTAYESGQTGDPDSPIHAALADFAEKLEAIVRAINGGDVNEVSSSVSAIVARVHRRNAIRVRQDFDRLLAATKAEGWTGETPVPPDFFDRVTDDSDSLDFGGLSLTLSFPNDATDEEMDDLCLEWIHALNNAYREEGGAGFTIDDLIIECEKPVPVGGPK
ncbi:MAG: hypothetical protein AAGD07_17490 [Planctomycetota bacterium]